MKPGLITTIQDLPSPLALVLEEYRLEERPYIKLHRLIDAAEMATRFLFIVGIADALQKLDPLPPELKSRLAKELPRPSFGKWKELLTATLQSLQNKKRTCFIPQLPDFWTKVWQPLIGDNEDSHKTAILPLRNHVAHVRVPDEAARQLLMPIQSAFEDGFQQLSELLRDYQLVAATRNDTGCLLRGLPQAGNPEPSTDLAQDWESGLVYLVDDSAHSLKLFPLHLYHDVLEKNETQHSGVSISASMLYLQYNPKRNQLEFTVLSPIGSDPYFWQSEGKPLQAFSEVFKIQDWEDEQRRYQDIKRGQDIAVQMMSEWKYGFEDLEKQYPALNSLYGRKKQLTEVQELIRHYFASGGYLWINGAPGVGKTAFMVGLRQRMRTDNTAFCISFFFRLGDVRCAPEHFYRAALLHLKQTPDETRTLKNQFVAALRRHVEMSGKPVLFLLDGMDEISDVYPDFAYEILARSEPGIVWICAGRNPAPDLTPDNCGESYVLQPLTEENVRQWLTDDLERVKYKLFERDDWQSDGSSRNVFVAALVKRSEGIPLYIMLTLQDLRADPLRLMDEDKLPQGLSGYYDQLLDRMKVSDASSVLTDILVLLSWTLEPLTGDTIEQILAPQYADDAPDWRKLVADTIRDAAFVLHLAPTPEQTWGWTLYHDSLRMHLQNMATVATARRRTQRLLLGWCKNWQTHRQPYAIRRYAQHLIEKGEWDALRQLLLVSADHQPWAEVRYELEQRYGGYLEDLVKLEHHAQESRDRSLQIECAVVRASIHTIIPFKWETAKTASTEVALDHIRHSLPGDDQVTKLRQIIQQHESNLPWDEILEIVAKMPANRVRTRALIYILSIPTVPLSEVRRLAKDLGKAEWVCVMTQLLPRLVEIERQHELLGEIKATIHQMQDDDEKIALMLALASSVPEPLKCSILRDTRKIAQATSDEKRQASHLKRLSRVFKESGFLDDALVTLQAIKSKFDRAAELTELAPSLPKTWREEAIRDAQNAAAAISDPKLLDKALALFVPPWIDNDVWDQEAPWGRKQTDVPVKTYNSATDRHASHPYEFDELWDFDALSEDIAAECKIGDEAARLESIARLSRYLPEALQEQVASQLLESVREVQDLQNRMDMLLVLWHDLPSPLQEKFLEEVEPSVLVSGEEEVALYFAQTGRFKRTIDTVRGIDYGPRRIECLFEVARHLPPSLRMEVREIALETLSTIDQDDETWDSTYRDSVWTVIARGLAEFGWFGEALAVARCISSENGFADFLIKLATYLPHTMHCELVNMARSVHLVNDRIEIFLALIPYISEREQKKLADETLALVRQHCGGEDLAHGLIRLHPYHSVTQQDSLLQEAKSVATSEFRALAEEYKAEFSGSLAIDLAIAGLPWEAMDMLNTIPSDKQRKLIPEIALRMVESGHFIEARKAVNRLSSPIERATALIKMLDYVKDHELDRTLQKVLDISSPTKDPKWLPIQKAIFPKLLERGFFEDALRIARGVDEEGLVEMLESSVFPVNLSGEAAEEFWQLAIHALAHQKRGKLLLTLPILAPLIVILDGIPPIVNAIDIIWRAGRCWP